MPEKPTVMVFVPLVTAKLELRLPDKFKAAAVLPIPSVAPAVVKLGAVTALLKVLLPEKVWLPFSKATFELNLESDTVPEEILLPLRLVRLVPETAGNCEEPFSCTSWLAPLKVLPCRVTFVESRVSLSVPELILLAFRLVKAEAFSAGRLPEPSSRTS